MEITGCSLELIENNMYQLCLCGAEDLPMTKSQPEKKNTENNTSDDKH